jgi:L-asparaginase II
VVGALAAEPGPPSAAQAAAPIVPEPIVPEPIAPEPLPRTGGRLDDPALLAEVIRGERVESRHYGHLVILDSSGENLLALGDTTHQLYSRSSLKPLQALAVLRTGLDLPSEMLALATASHSGEPMHVELAAAMLARAGLSEADLACPARDGSRLKFNCSGKHAAMLAACVASGWPVEGYLDPGHPLQGQIRATVEELCGAPSEAVAIDGCGAPQFTVTLAGLAGAYRTLVQAPEGRLERRVADAMRAHPLLVGGTGRWSSRIMAAVPGVVLKEGAEGVVGGAAADLGAFSFKVDDGSDRPRPPLTCAALRRLGVGVAVDDDLAEPPVFGGGHPVGSVRQVGVTIPV